MTIFIDDKGNKKEVISKKKRTIFIGCILMNGTEINTDGNFFQPDECDKVILIRKGKLQYDYDFMVAIKNKEEYWMLGNWNAGC